MPAAEIIGLLILGLCAGTIGGLVGVGGSIIIIPILTLLMDRDQHISQAAAMIINVFVAAPALFHHHKADAVRWDVMVRMLPLGLIFILVGVQASNYFDGELLKSLFGVFLIYVILFNIAKLFDDGRHSQEDPPAEVGWGRVAPVGGAMGFVAGILGIGGGPVAVPLLQRVCHLPLRQAIASSSAVMCLTALIGAVRKNATLAHLADAAGNPLNLHVQDSLILAAYLAPTATIGALIGARLTHTLPLRWVRLAFVLLLVWASLSMLGVIELG